MIILGRDVNLIGSNLNTYGNAGDFETDRSTWGFADQATYWSVTRSTAFTYYETPGIYSARISATGTKTPVKTLLIPGNFNAVLGKKYYIKASVVLPAGSNIYNLIGSLRLFSEDTGWQFVAQVTHQLSSAVNRWRKVELMIERTGASQNNAKVYLGIDDVTQTNGASGEIYVDKLEIQEYEDIITPCTLDIDVANTTVTDETTAGADDGSISVAYTGGTAPVEYSKDGINWQSSNQFTGLAPGVYTIQMRDSHTPTPCTDTQAFSVNAADIDFTFETIITDETVAGASDGQIEVTVTGTGGPFQYSKDGGATYQGSNIFSGLAPGDYTMVVKDSGDNTLSLIVTVNAGIVVFDLAWLSKNPIPFERYSSSNYAEDNYKVMIDVQVEEPGDTGQFTSVMKTAMPSSVSAAGQLIQFNLSPAFRGVLTAIPPDHNEGNLVKITDRRRLFKVLYGDIYNQLDEPAAWTPTPVQLVLLGGVSKFKYPTIDYLYSYLPTNKKFMTWAPLTKEVDYNQEDYLQFWVYNDTITTVKLMVKAYFDDDTNETATITTVTTKVGDLLQVPAGPLNSQAIGINPAKNLSYYELWLANQSDAAISEVRTYTLSPFTHPRARYFLFLNSLGAYEVLRTTGHLEESSDIERSVSERVLTLDYEPLDGQFAAGDATKQNMTKVSSGILAGADAQEWLEYMQDAAMSSRVFDITSGERVPIINQTKKITVLRTEDNRRFVRFDFMNAYSDHSYTPHDA